MSRVSAFPAFSDAAPQRMRDVAPAAEIQTVRIELGRRRLTPHERRALRPGTIVTLDEPVDEPVNVYRDDVLIARGRLVLLEDKLCVRVTERIG